MIALGSGAGGGAGAVDGTRDCQGHQEPGARARQGHDHSATCHGATGKGNGAAAAALTPKPADWTSVVVQSQTDGELFWKITNGRGAMPPWLHLPDRERWELVNDIRTLKKK